MTNNTLISPDATEETEEKIITLEFNDEELIFPTWRLVCSYPQGLEDYFDETIHNHICHLDVGDVSEDYAGGEPYTTSAFMTTRVFLTEDAADVICEDCNKAVKELNSKLTYAKAFVTFEVVESSTNVHLVELEKFLTKITC